MAAPLSGGAMRENGVKRAVEPLHVDGAYGEGGGQLVRTALALAAITGRGARLDRIRARCKTPGLRAQHLTAVRALAEICQARVSGAELGSRELTFEPTIAPQPGDYHWEIGTAGAVTLVLQAVLWPLALAPGVSRIALTGGTHVEWSPPLDYVQQVYLPMLDLLLVGDDRIPDTLSLRSIAEVAVKRWGWYPRGGGTIQAHIRGDARLCSRTLNERGSLRVLSVLSAASGLPDHVRERQASRADFFLRKNGFKAQVEMLAPPSLDRGTVVFVLAEYRNARAGFAAYGRLRKPAEQVAEEACKAFLRYHRRGQPVDRHLGDQILLPFALARWMGGGNRSPTEYAVE